MRKRDIFLRGSIASFLLLGCSSILGLDDPKALPGQADSGSGGARDTSGSGGTLPRAGSSAGGGSRHAGGAGGAPANLGGEPSVGGEGGIAGSGGGGESQGPGCGPGHVVTVVTKLSDRVTEACRASPLLWSIDVTSVSTDLTTCCATIEAPLPLTFEVTPTFNESALTLDLSGVLPVTATPGIFGLTVECGDRKFTGSVKVYDRDAPKVSQASCSPDFKAAFVTLQGQNLEGCNVADCTGTGSKLECSIIGYGTCPLNKPVPVDCGVCGSLAIPADQFWIAAAGAGGAP